MKLALFKLVEALNKVGYDEDALQIHSDDEGLSVTVRLDVPLKDVIIEVTLGERSFGLCNYYVSFTTTKGDFAHYMGTPFVEKALMNLGGAIQSANEFSLRREK